jgi:hypothetical protein
MATNPTGSILVRRGPTADRLAFCPLNGEIIYDTTTDMFYIGDGVTLGGVSIVQRTFPSRGVMIKGTSAESFLVAPGNNSGSDYQFLVYSKLNGQYEFSTITASGVAITNLKLTGANGLVITRTDTSPVQVNPIITTTGQITVDVDPVPFKTAISLQNVTNESKATMFTSPAFTGTPTGITATHVGLGNVTNESKATMFANPTFTGTITGTLARTFTVNGNAFNGSADVNINVTGAVGNTGPAGPSTYDLFNFVNGKPLVSEVLMRAITVRIYTIAANFTGCIAYCTTGATTAQTINILKNGSVIGTIAFAIGATSGTFSGSPSGVTMNIGDQLQLQMASGASQDASFSDLAFTIKGTSS